MEFFKKYHVSGTAFLYLIALFFLASCGQNRKKENQHDSDYNQLSDLQRIRETGTLKVIIDYNSSNYFIYRGKPMGYKYELIQALCNHLEVKPEFTVSNNMAETFDGLKTGRFDLIAKNLTVTREWAADVDFTQPLKQTRQVLVQRKPGGNTPDSMYLKSTLEMAGKEIHIQQNSSYYRRLYNLSEEIGSLIKITEDSLNGVEQLVAMVARGEIDYTVCNENVALLNSSYYPNLDVSLKISFPQHIAWAVRKGSPEWREFLNEWIMEFKKSGEYRRIYHHYFVRPRTAGRFSSNYHSITGGKISDYDDLVKEIALKHGWDWRLISSIMFHESRFDPDAESWSGAFGLMQLIPATAESLGVEDIMDPRQNIEGGILLLNWLDKQLIKTIPDSTERVKFVLASYNIGLGHVKDAQRLAKKFGKDSHIWENNVDFYLRHKSSEKYFMDPVVRWGYARGEEAFNFVNRVIVNYEHYRNLIPE
jgi:membrane-bound lytic murein transglycosylase F